MKKEKFDFGIFILDCFMSFGLIVVSIVLFFVLQVIIRVDDFYAFAALLTFSHTSMFIIYFFLEKTNIIQYRIYKPSFWFVFISINSFWWFVAYWLSHNFKTYS